MAPQRCFAGLLALALVVAAPLAFADEAPSPHTHGSHAPAAPAAKSGGHGSDAHGAHHVPHFSDVNWIHGVLGEKEGVEPSVLWRPKGMPLPVGVLIFNSAILFFLIYRFGKAPLQAALKNRRDTLMQGMDEAAKMKAEAEATLAGYEAKLDKIHDEIARVQSSMREAAKSEQQRILSEARERQARMERDAKLLVEQELKAARLVLMNEVTREVVASATELLQKQLGAADQARLADEFLGSLDAKKINATGGAA
jgi:F-type H+-transporting ATPase subunit b